MSLSNYRTAVVTGASSGIGAATARALSKYGLTVHVIARRSDRLAERTDCIPHVLDVRDTKALKFLLSSLNVDILINNAGVGRGYRSLAEANSSDIDCTLDTNVHAAVHAVHAVLPSMIKNGSGHIVNIGSMAGLYSLPSALYGASKAATDVYLQERMENGYIKGFITRAFSHTGPRRGRIFSISSDEYQIARMIRGLQEPILKVGNLETTRVVMDVRDTVRAYYLAMIHPDVTNHVFNICGDTPRKMQFFTDKLIELSGLDHVEQKIHKPFWSPHEIHYQHGDSTNHSELTGFKEEYDIETTLDDLLRYWVDKL